MHKKKNALKSIAIDTRLFSGKKAREEEKESEREKERGKKHERKVVSL